jgi:hypothetical protein
MAGLIKSMIDSIVEQRARGNPTVVMTTRTKIHLKGVNPNRFGADSPDDDAVIAKLKAIAADMGVRA